MLVGWDRRLLYEKLIDEPGELDAFLADVVSAEWHFQHDAGLTFAETSAELIARYPEHEALIAAYGPRFLETIPGPIAGMPELLAELDATGVPLFAITNFSAEFWPPFAERYAGMIDRFRAVVVSGEERLTKPDPAIYALALKRFGLGPGEGMFIDDRPENVAGAEAAGLVGHLFQDAATLRQMLVGHGLLA